MSQTDEPSMTLPDDMTHGGPVVRRFLFAMAMGNLIWEVAHVPLYTLWVTDSSGEIAYSVLHCTGGDVLIAASSLTIAWLLFGRCSWPHQSYWRVATVTIMLAVGYTVFSEWLNVDVRGSWAYRDLMPRLPWLGTGLTPLLQWIVVPALAFCWARPGSGSV